MPKIYYSDSFKKALEVANEKKLFLGSGNPNAQILILGKEAAINRNSVEGNHQYENEYSNNLSDWNRNVNESIQLDSVGLEFNSLYPYKGQLNKLNRKVIINNSIQENQGTSKTWCCYQRIIDHIYNNQIKSTHITFHEHVFTSELNQETGKYSRDIPFSKRKESIATREALFATPFFREFPITIVAVGHYIRDFQIDLQKLFKVTYDYESSIKASEGLQKEYLNIHFDQLVNPKRILIHTNQLSMVSNALLDRIGEVCKNFLNP